MKKAKAFTKRKVTDFVRSGEEFDLPVIEPLENEDEKLEVQLETSEILSTVVEETPLLTNPQLEATEDLVQDAEWIEEAKEAEVENHASKETLNAETHEDSKEETLVGGQTIETDKSKKHFWNTYKRQVIEEPISIESQSPQTVVKEERVKMSYSAKQSGYTSESAAVISNTMVIRGDIELDTALVVAGRVVGNVKCKDIVESKSGGSVEGDIQAETVKLIGGEVKGNIICAERVEVDAESKVTGDVSAKDIVLSGSITGEVKAAGMVTLTHSASIKGDLYAGSVSIEAGAKLDGKFVVQSNA